MTITIIGIISIILGLLSLGASYVSVMRRRRPAVAWGFGIVAALCLTVVPVTLAVFWAATTNSY